jgi:hypothetical protein
MTWENRSTSGFAPRDTDVYCQTLGVIVLFHRDDDIALFVPLVNIPVSLDHLLQWIASINDWLYLPRFNEFCEVPEIFRLWDGCLTYPRVAQRGC